MRNLVWIILLVVIIGLGAGFLALGAFPPEPKTQTIQRVLPNDRFAPKP
jgi:hypothetical protein